MRESPKGRRLVATVCLAGALGAVVAAGLATGAAGAPAGEARGSQDRYAIANGCLVLRARSAGRAIARSGRDGYRASASSTNAAEPFRLKATDLGKYLMYDRSHDLFANPAGDRVGRATGASPRAEWEVREAGGALMLVSLVSRKALNVNRSGRLELIPARIAGRTARFDFVPVGGCAQYPEAEVNAAGEPFRGETRYGEVFGTMDGHQHFTGFELFGGRAHCGRPWHRYGVSHALVDCPDHYPNGAGAVLENATSEDVPVATHDPVGWPTFRDWPRHDSLTHEQTYYKWIERAWRAGLRLVVNDLVENGVLCDLYPLKKNNCNEMASARNQAHDMRKLERYIDAQSGGPGKGWFRIVKDPFEARRVINDGKLAVVMGIEMSALFDCTLENEVPRCDRAHVDRALEEFHRLGLRSAFPIHKFDNAFGGVAFDEHLLGPAVNTGNRIETGRYWRIETCKRPPSDKEQEPTVGHSADLIAKGLDTFLPGATPIYPAPPHCNVRGLTALGKYLIRKMMDKGMIVEVDHMSVKARRQALSLLEKHHYSGVISSHSWADEPSLPRIYRLGGMVTPHNEGSIRSPTEAFDVGGFVGTWRKWRRYRSNRYYFGFGYGADSNGISSQPAPRPPEAGDPVRYPFRSLDPHVTVDRQRTGKRVFDYNREGVAHYGLHPDWFEDLRIVGGEQLANEMSRGAEAYLQMWERAHGVPNRACRGARARFTRRGLGRQRLRLSPDRLLRRAGQPGARGRAWRYCVQGRRNRRAKVVAVFTRSERVGLVGSTARRHTARGIGPGASSRRLRSRTRRFGRGVRIRRAGRRARIVYGARRGRVRFVAVADRSVLASRRRLRHYLKLAGLR